ncbi:hypothetical protein TRVA0_036S00914 [Trichomonascus vanleenenianus]|uniref:WD40 repeat domain-containing protein n=1 Tax=Trichomonascus vanleenenianus TaxID=2268995 RepID=UPI003ECB0DF8
MASPRSASPHVLQKLKRSSYADGKPVLRAKSIIGTTAASQSTFCVVGNSVAYTAGAGGVIAHLDSVTSRIDDQRFYCTSAKLVQAIQQSAAEATVVQWPGEYLYGHGARDAYGFLLSQSSNYGGGPQPTGANGSAPGGSFSPSHGTSLSLSGEDLTNLLTTKSTPVKEKMKTATCITMSGDGRLLAVGESGHQPHIFVYSTACDASTTKPLAILSEHRYGIKCLAFSPCGKYLASLGNYNDGFLHVWYLSLKEGTVQLHSSNRCISMVHDMKWINSSRLITTGIRHVRVWKVDNLKPPKLQATATVLQGRNVVLNDFSKSNFVTIAVLSEDMAIVATDRGELVTVEANSGGICELHGKLATGSDISSIDVDLVNGVLYLGGPNNLCKALELKSVLSSTITGSPQKPKQSAPAANQPPNDSVAFLEPPINVVNGCSGDDVDICAVALWRARHVVGLSSWRQVQVIEFADDSSSPVSADSIIGTHAQELRGIRAVGESQDKFLTWSADGKVRIWNNQGVCLSEHIIRPRQPQAELAIACLSTSEGILFVGDTVGDIQIVDIADPKEAIHFNAHGSRVVEMDYFYDVKTGRHLFASCSRDRTVQVFAKLGDNSWELHQTLPSHKGNILAVYFTKSGRQIVSCSTDRTVNVHSIADNGDDGEFALYSTNVISLKSTPLDMCLEPLTDNIVVSSDKQILMYKVTGEFVAGYRTVDENHDTISLQSITMGVVNSKQYLAGMGHDKGIRIYEHPGGTVIGSDWGHSEGVSGVAWISDAQECIIVSSGFDGCVFLWRVKHDDRSPTSGSYRFNGSRSPNRASPARKVLSKAELSRFLPQVSSPQLQTPTQSKVVNRSPTLSQLRSPATPTPIASSTPGTPTAIGQRQLGRRESSLGLRRSLQPSKSLSELRPRKSSPLEESQNAVNAMSESRTPRLGRSPVATKTTEIDSLIGGLSRFREQYKQQKGYVRSSVVGQKQVEKLKQELKLTLRMLEGTIQERVKLDQMFEVFSDQLISVVKSKLDDETSKSAFSSVDKNQPEDETNKP